MNKIAVIVSSCDAFSDCWGPFIFSVKKYWKNLPCEINIVSNHKSINDDIVRFIKVGEDKGWASNLILALKEIDAEYILYLQEDYWLTRTVSTEKFLSQVSYCHNNGVDYLRLSYPYCDRNKIDDSHAVSPIKTEKYALCLQPAIWKKSTFERLLVDGWSGWDYEANVCKYAVDNNIPVKSEVLLSYVNEGLKLLYVDYTAVRKGKWTRPGRMFLMENGFGNIINLRQTEGWFIDKLAILRNITIFHPFASILIRMMNKFKINI